MAARSDFNRSDSRDLELRVDDSFAVDDNKPSSATSCPTSFLQDMNRVSNKAGSTMFPKNRFLIFT